MNAVITRNIGLHVDRLGELKANISDLNGAADVEKSAIISAAVETGEGAFEGVLFRAAVSFAQKSVVDYKAVVAALAEQAGISAADLAKLVKRHTAVAESFPVVRVSARKGV